MTILISNLEDWLEEMSDDEMQQISGGTTVTSDVYPSEARNGRSEPTVLDVDNLSSKIIHIDYFSYP